MYRVVFFYALRASSNGEQHYGDAINAYLDLDFRPMVGDLFPFHIIHMPWYAPPWKDESDKVLSHTSDVLPIDVISSDDVYEVEKVLYAGNNVFFAYCVLVEKSEQGKHNLGIRGDTGSLVYHYAEQTHAFHHRHNGLKGEKSTITSTKDESSDDR